MPNKISKTLEKVRMGWEKECSKRVREWELGLIKLYDDCVCMYIYICTVYRYNNNNESICAPQRIYMYYIHVCDMQEK